MAALITRRGLTRLSSSSNTTTPTAAMLLGIASRGGGGGGRRVLGQQIPFFFSTTRSAPSNTNTSGAGNGNGNPTLPKFSLKSIVPNPRMRRIVIGLLCVSAVAEGATYYFWLWPKYFGNKGAKEEEEGGESS